MAYHLSNPIHLVAYDPDWPILFEQEKQRILNLLGPVLIDVQHFGSTSVPGLAAKPLLDLLGAVRTLDDIPACAAALHTLGYEDASVYLGGWIIGDRRLFCKGPYNEGTHHLHLVQYGSETWVHNLRFRDYLRAHPEAVAEYMELKTRLAGTHQTDIDGYTEGKSEFIRAIMNG
jgi:GrpB-like predicted nucleotidyltransferase (UPF0157 family)